MNKVIYPDRIAFNPPFLINEKSLIELDNIVEEGWKQYLAIQDENFKNELEEQVKKYPSLTKEKLESDLHRNYRYQPKKVIEIIFKSGNKLRSNSFQEAVKEPFAKNEIPIGFNYNIETYFNKMRISISEDKDSQLDVSVTPDNPTNIDVLYKLRQWSESIQSNRWIRIWREYSIFIWGVFAIFILLSTIPLSVKTDTYQETLTKQASEILKNGIDSSKINKSLELLLYNNYKIKPPGLKEDSSNNFIWYLTDLIFLIIAIIVSFPPRTYLGFGKGFNKIKYWRIWLKIISIYIPVSIVLPIVLNIISNILLIRT